MTDPENNLDYETALTELESILTELESPRLPLSALQAKVRRAQELLGFCRAKLREVSLELSDWKEDNDSIAET
jgi:exodeoxyribonuclease VII small subunit